MFRFRPWQRWPAELMFDPSVQQISLQCYSGAGKTFLLGAGFCYGAVELKENMGVMMPGALAALKWGKKEFAPLVESCPALDSIGYAKGGDTGAEKIWNNGASLTLLGSSQHGDIRRLQAGVLYADEIDSLTAETSDEGDKLGVFLMRSRGRPRAFHWVSSYPSLKGRSKIDAECARSTLFRWEVDCPGCGSPWVMDIDRDLVVPAEPENAAVRCPTCKRSFSDGERRGIVDAGRWTTEDAPTGRFAFHLNALSHMGGYPAEKYKGWLHFIAEELRKIDTAEDPEKQKRVFCNTIKAESYEPPKRAKGDPSVVAERCEDYDPDVELPPGVLVVTLGVDVQGDRLEMEYVGYGLNRETWGLGYHVINGDTSQPLVWDKLDEMIGETFKHPSGKTLKPAVVAVDSGFLQEEVVRFCRPRRVCFAVKGAKAFDAPVVARAKNGNLLDHHQPKVGTQEAKSIWRSRLALEPNDDGSFPQGYCHFPRRGDYNDGYFKMLFAEDSELRTTLGGAVVEVFTCPEGVRNEATDIRVYSFWAYLAPQFKLKLIKKQMWSDNIKHPKRAKGGGFASRF